MKILVVLCCLTLASPALAIGHGAVQPRALQEATELNSIGTQLLASRLRSEGVGNMMVSSVSLFHVLSILELGAAGSTAELLRSRQLSDPKGKVAEIAQQLAAVLEQQAGGGGAAGFQISNSLWSTNGESNGLPFVFADDFVAAAEAIYSAEHQMLDFMAAQSARVINDWAREQTRGLIPSIVDPGLLSMLEWAILNTVLFEGSWGTPMRRMPADDRFRFVDLDGMPQKVESISTRDYVAGVVDRDDGSVAFQLPFAGGKYAFIMHVPAKAQADIAQWMIEDAVPGIAGVVKLVLENHRAPHQLSIRLPVFAFSDSVTMSGQSPTTRDMGIAALFTGDVNLSRLVDRERTPPSNQATRVGIIKQDTRIELDEKGVRAAAATLIGGVRATTVGPRFPRREIIVDRPFVFAIVDKASRTMLFNGTVVSPPPGDR